MVPPHQEIRTYNASSADWNFYEGSPFAVMDLRGVGRLSEDEWILAGGMTTGAQVTNAVYKITRGPLSSETQSIPGLNAFSAGNSFFVQGIPRGEFIAEVYDLSGRLITSEQINQGDLVINVEQIPSVIYILKVLEIDFGSTRQATFKLPKL